jgi:ribose/xylose/arabinose/galactoside ABC-type transport system permease subunit
LFITTLNQCLALKNVSSGLSTLANGVVLVVAIAMVTAATRGRLRMRRVGVRLKALVDR